MLKCLIRISNLGIRSCLFFTEKAEEEAVLLAELSTNAVFVCTSSAHILFLSFKIYSKTVVSATDQL